MEIKNISDALNGTVLGFSDFLLHYFVALAAVGALSMAIVQLWKKISRAEARFHAKAVTEWFTSDEKQQQENRPKAFGELIHLGIGVDLSMATKAAEGLIRRGGKVEGCNPFKRPNPEDLFFALPLERLVVHIQNASDVALRHSERYPALFSFIMSGAHQQDVSDWKNVNELTDRVRSDMYSRLQLIAKQKLAAFQLITNERWVNSSQRSALIVGFIVMSAALCSMGVKWSDGFVLALTGGMLAPVAKDIVESLRNVRKV